MIQIAGSGEPVICKKQIEASEVEDWVSVLSAVVSR